MNGLRRTPEAIITAHKMDPDRRELYVEGNSDRLFFKWLVGNDSNPNSIIKEISEVEIKGPVEGGERSRVLILANKLNGKVDYVRMFIDADFDRLLSRVDSIPEIVWLSDGRDLESYFLRYDCFEKFVTLSLCTDVFSGIDVLNSLITHCRKLGFLRLYSEKKDLKLPFQNTNLHRHLNFSHGEFTFEFEAYIRSLIGKVGLSQSEHSLVNRISKFIKHHSEIIDTEIIHGHDFTCFIGEVLSSFSINRNASRCVFRPTFERRFSIEYQTLTEVLSFLCN